MSTQILLIDDDLISLYLYKTLLTWEGYTCSARARPIMDVTEVANLAPSLIIMDWFQGTMETATSLPTIDFLLGLRQVGGTAHIPILICSGAASQMHTLDDWFAGLGATLVDKPFEVDALLARIAALVHS